MIPRTVAPPPAPVGPPEAAPRPLAPAWTRLLGEAVGSVGELLDLLGLAPDDLPGALAAHRDFPLRVPRGFVARMRPGDPRDPLLLQVLPAGVETRDAIGFVDDPLGEEAAAAAPGLLHKYRGRALLLVTGACGVHCRYCFRRHFPYSDHRPWADGWAEALAYLARAEDVVEVVLSGGDPLSVVDEKLATLAADLARLPRLRRIRIHTRMPIVLPERVDDALLGWLAGTRLAPVVVVHANHPREVDDAVVGAIARLRGAGVVVLNQAVLLRGVNDDVATLAELSETLFAAGVLPYYLNLLDRVRGAAHFEVGEEEARTLVRDLASRLSGYLVPRLVREVSGASGKLPIDLRMAPPAVARESIVVA